MALFESYDRRIDHINAVLKRIWYQRHRRRKGYLRMLKASTHTQCVRKLSLSASRTHAGLT